MANTETPYSTGCEQENEKEIPRNNSSSLRRALAIVSCIASDESDPGGLTITELGRLLAIDKSTVSRLLAPLCDEHLIERDNETGRYSLGPRTAHLAEIYLERLDLRTAARPSLLKLMEATEETVHLVTFDPPDIVYVDKIESPKSVRMFSRVGSRQPAYSTGAGKAFLAHASEEVVRNVVSRGLVPRTATTITTETALRAELEITRKRGYAIDDVENEADIRCVGAPIFDRNRVVVAAASVSGPAHRVTREHVGELGRLVAETCAQVSTRLGWPGKASANVP